MIYTLVDKYHRRAVDGVDEDGRGSGGGPWWFCRSGVSTLRCLEKSLASAAKIRQQRLDDRDAESSNATYIPQRISLP